LSGTIEKKVIIVPSYRILALSRHHHTSETESAAAAQLLAAVASQCSSLVYQV
jgi:hypothetical protein